MLTKPFGMAVYLICVRLNIFIGILFVVLRVVYVGATHATATPDYNILSSQCLLCFHCFD